jgi:streptogramin lyase
MKHAIIAFAVVLALVGCQDRSGVATPWATSQNEAHPLVVQGGSKTPSWGQFQVISGYGLFDIARGPEGDLWLTDRGDDSIIRFSPSGKSANFAIPNMAGAPVDLTEGPDLSMWFTMDGGKVGRLTRSGGVRVFSLPYPNQTLGGIITGPDGNLWFTQNQGNSFAAVNRISPSGKFLTYYPLPNSASDPNDLILGSDGNVWVNAPGADSITRVTANGSTTQFYNPFGGASCITSGPDGNIWFSTPSYIGYMTPTGDVTGYFLLGGNAECITAGPDDHLWVMTANRPLVLVRIALNGTQQFYSLKGPDITGNAIITGPDGNIWFTEYFDGNESGAIGVYIRKVLKVSPSSVTFTGIGQTADLSAKEKGFDGSLTAATSNSAVATVTNGTSKDTFVVTAVGSGSATVTIADDEKNTYPVSVSVP